MMDMFTIFALLQEGRQGLDNFFAGVVEYLNQLNLGTGELGLGGIVVALVVVWFFVRLVRTLVSILIAVLVLLLVLHVAGYVDISAVWEQVSAWLNQASPADTAGAAS